MKKRLWTILILLLVIAVAVGVLMYLNKEEPFKQDRTLYSYPDRSVEQIRIVSKDGEIFFVKQQGQWVMAEPASYKIDVVAVSMLENRLKDFLVSRILDAEPGDIQRYGLDNPAATISFRLDDGTEHTLFIGEMAASKVQYYAKDAARDNIFILGSYDVENFLRPVNEFRDRTILAVDTEAVNELSLDVLDTREFQLAGDDSGAWRIVAPLGTDARSDAVREMLDNIRKLKIKDFVTGGADDPGRFGLESPAYTLELKDNKQNAQKICFGRIDDETQAIYIKVDDHEEVYTLSLEVFDPRRFKIADFLDVAPLSVAIPDIHKVVIIEDGSATEFLRDTSTGEEDLFTYSGKAVGKEDFIALYVNIMALTAEGYDPENSGGTPALTVVLELKDNAKTITAEFVKRDDLSYYLVLNGEPEPFFIGERKIDLIKRWRDRVLEGI